MSDEDPAAEQPFRPDLEPFSGFEVSVITDRPVYAAGDTVRITVTATNAGDRWVEHEYAGWQRFETTVRDEYHRVVAHDLVQRWADGPVRDRWLPGQLVIFPLYWGQQQGPIVPAWSDELPGPRVASGRYRVRVTWKGREWGRAGEPADGWSSWFEIV